MQSVADQDLGCGWCRGGLTLTATLRPTLTLTLTAMVFVVVAGYRDEDGVGGFAVAYDGTVCLDNNVVVGAVGCYYALLAPGVELWRGRVRN